MSEFFTCATVNTHMGRFFRDLRDLAKIADCTAVGFQEAHPDRDNIEEKLITETDLVLASVATQFGLVIAVNKDCPTSNEHHFTLQERGPIGCRLTDLEAGHKTAFRARARGIHGVTIARGGNDEIHFANGHPIIPFKNRQRIKQVVKVPIGLAHVRGRLVYVQDGNHCPGPRPVDLAMHHALGVIPVDIGREPTYVLERSKHRWLGVLPTRWILQFDDILYRGEGLNEEYTEVIDIESDHRAIKTKFSVEAKDKTR